MYLTYLSDEEIVDHICVGIKLAHTNKVSDKAWWMGRTIDIYSVKSAWQIVRARRCKKEIEKHLSVKQIPFKINFFFWRAWKGRITIEDNLMKMGINMSYNANAVKGILRKP